MKMYSSKLFIVFYLMPDPL